MMLGLLGALVSLGGMAHAEAANDTPGPSPKTPDYLGVVRAFADAMLEHGRDVYGDEHSPLFAAALDPETLQLPQGKKLESLLTLKREQWGIRPHDRTLSGANPMQDQDFYKALYGLTELTGDRRYAKAADEALTWFFQHCQSPKTGLMTWGEHLGWDFFTEKPTALLDTHEYARPWLLWDRCYRLAPEACHRFALGVWDHQIHDHKTCGFSRHACYSRHKTAPHPEFPRHGGFFIATWAAAYQHTEDPRMLRAIESLVGKFEASRHEDTGAIPPSTGPKDSPSYWPPSNLSLAIDLGEGAKKVPSALAEKMRACAARTDKVFLKTSHDMGPNGKGFAIGGSRKDLKGTNFCETWSAAYGTYTDARLALMCLERHDQTKNDAYQRLALAAGKKYLNSNPDESVVVWPGTMGDVILLMCRLHQVNGEETYLERANQLATKAVALFFRGDSALPRASSQHDQYEAITQSDTLAMALLELWAIQNDHDPLPEFRWGNR